MFINKIYNMCVKLLQGYVIPFAIYKENTPMKKIISISLAFIMIALSFCACSKPTAKMSEGNVKKTVNTAFSALKDFDTEDLKKYVDSSTLSIIIAYAEQHQQFIDLGKAIFKNLDYEIKEVDLDRKTVVVSVKNKNLAAAAQNFADGLKGFSTFELLSKLSDETWLDEKLSELTSAISASPDKEDYVDITLHIKEAGDHLTIGFTGEAEDEVSGGAITAIKSVF